MTSYFVPNVTKPKKCAPACGHSTGLRPHYPLPTPAGLM